MERDVDDVGHNVEPCAVGGHRRRCGLTVDGTERVIEADAFEARALVHELDHLDGVLFLDRVSSHESLFRRKVYK